MTATTDFWKRALLFAMTGLVALPMASAQLEVLGKVRQSLGIVFLGDYFKTDFTFWMKFLLFWLVFTLLFFVASKLFENKKNMALVLSLIVSAIGVFPMKDAWLLLVFTIWHGIIGIILVIVPIIGLVYFAHSVLQEENRVNFMLKAVIYYVMSSALYHIAQASAGTQPFASIKGLKGGAELATALCMIISLWYVFRAIVGPGGAAAVAHAAAAAAHPPGAAPHAPPGQQPQPPGHAPPGAPPHQPPAQHPPGGVHPANLQAIQAWYAASLAHIQQDVARFQHTAQQLAQALAHANAANPPTAQHRNIARQLDNYAATILQNIHLVVSHPGFALLTPAEQNQLTHVTQQFAVQYNQLAQARIAIRNALGIII